MYLPRNVKPLKRGKACLTCRFIKLKCDGERPICGPCMRNPKEDPCEYADGPGRSRTKVLEETIARLEARISELENPTLHDPYSLPGPNFYHNSSSSSNPFPSSSQHQPDYYPNSASNSPSSMPSMPPSPHRGSPGSSWNHFPPSLTRSQSSGIGYGFSHSVSSSPRSASSLHQAGVGASPSWSLYGSETGSGDEAVSGDEMMLWDVNTDPFDGPDLTGQVIKLQMYPFECGGVADLYRGQRVADGTLVAIKVFRRMHKDPEAFQRSREMLYKEAKSWRDLTHANIMPFLGICHGLAPSPALISPLCSHGSIMKYLKDHNKTPEEKIQLVSGIADGLAHLHNEGIIHGNLSTSKILVNENNVPMICGYGMSKVLNRNGQHTSLLPSAVRFTAPEYFAPDPSSGASSERTPSGDVYSFSMVMLEVLSGVQPYHDFPSDHSVLFHIVHGGRPLRTDFVPEPISNELWVLLMQLWSQLPSFRPRMDAVREHINDLRAGKDSSTLHPEALHTSLAMEIEDRSILDLTKSQKAESSSSGEETSFGDLSLPEYKSLDLTGRIVQADQYPFAGGGNSNLYRGKLLRGEKKSIRVAIKMIRVPDAGMGQSQLEDIVRKLRREAAIWSRLTHKNLLPFIGICYDIAPWPVLVSPFYKNGHVRQYLQANPSTDKSRLILGAAAGLEYLHSKDVVHGDLKVQNVLIDKQGNACICDFGISRLLGSRGFTTSCVGTAPYMAPELFFVIDAIDHIKTTPKTTKESDVYSFGLLALEISTSESLKARPVRPIITSLAHSKLRPVRSDYESFVELGLWIILNRCWVTEPSSRPTIKSLLLELRQGFLEQKSNREITWIPDNILGERPSGFNLPPSQSFNFDPDASMQSHPTLNRQSPPEVVAGGRRLATGKDARIHMCKVPGCGKCFARGEHLKRHVRSIHAYEKPHKCPHPGCGKDFSRHDNLGQHMRVHKDFVRP